MPVTTLGCGLRVDIRRGRGATASFGAVFGAGLRFDPVDTPGLAHLCEHVFLQSVSETDRHESALGLRLAAGLSAHTLTETVEFSVDGPVAGLVDAVDELLGPDPAGRATPHTLTRQRDIVGEELSQLLRTRHGGYVWRHLPGAIFADWAHGHEGFGSEATLAAVTIDEVGSFLRDRYQFSNATLAIVADADPNLVLSALADRASGWVHGPPGDHTEPTLYRLHETPRHVVHDVDLACSFHAFGWVLPELPEPAVPTAMAVTALIDRRLQGLRQPLTDLGCRTARASLGYFGGLSAGAPFICVVVADLMSGADPAPDDLWRLIRQSDGAWITEEILSQSAKAGSTDVLLELSHPGRRALLLARRLLLDGHELDEEAFVRGLREPPAEVVLDLVRALPVQPQGILTVAGRHETARPRTRAGGAGQVMRQGIEMQLDNQIERRWR